MLLKDIYPGQNQQITLAGYLALNLQSTSCSLRESRFHTGRLEEAALTTC